MRMLPLFRLGRWLLGWVLLSLASVACSETTAWEHYKERFVAADGRVVDTGNNNVSHSEGQGWGMILAALHDDPETFERLWAWTQRALVRDDLHLFAWRYDPARQPPVDDYNNATDGDLFIAWALQLAGERWNQRNYLVASTAIRKEIAAQLVREFAGYQVLVPGLVGFAADHYVDLNLSYWFMPALQHFARIDAEGPWKALVDDGQRLLEEARFGAEHLPTDWVRLNADGTLLPAPQFPPRFGFDAVRIPLYFIWAGLDDQTGLEDIAAFWQEGAQSPAWVDVTSGERADYAVSAGVASIQAVLLGTAPELSETALTDEDYYSTSLMLLSQLAAAGSTATLNLAVDAGTLAD